MSGTGKFKKVVASNSNLGIGNEEWAQATAGQCLDQPNINVNLNFS